MEAPAGWNPPAGCRTHQARCVTHHQPPAGPPPLKRADNLVVEWVTLLVDWLGELIDVVEEPTTSLSAGPPPLERADIVTVIWLALLVDSPSRNPAPRSTGIRPFQGRGTIAPGAMVVGFIPVLRPGALKADIVVLFGWRCLSIPHLETRHSVPRVSALFKGGGPLRPGAMVVGSSPPFPSSVLLPYRSHT